MLGTMLRVPEFRGDEDIFALQSWNAAVECFLERLCDFFLVAVAVERTAVSPRILLRFKFCFWIGVTHTFARS
jgi:hypothetical protein